MWLLWWAGHLTLSFGVVVHIRHSDEMPFKEALMLPVYLPRLVQDPQNIPFKKNRSFFYAKGGVLSVNLTVRDAITPKSDKLPGFQLFYADNSKPAALHEPVGFFNTTSHDYDFSDTAAQTGSTSFRGYRIESTRLRPAATSSKLEGSGKDPLHKALSIPTAIPTDAAVDVFGSLDHGTQLSASLTEEDYLMPTNSNMRNTSMIPPLGSSRYIMLFTAEQWNNLNMTLISSALYDHHWYVSGVSSRTLSSYFKSALRVPIEDSHIQFSYSIPYEANCLLALVNPLGTATMVDGVVKMVNPGENQLSLEDFALRPTVFAALLLNVATSLVLGVLLVTLWRHSRTDLHVLMTINFLIKSIYLLFDWRNLSLFSLYGELDTFSWVLPRMIAKVKDIVSLVLILLLSLGWKVYRRQLTVLEVRFCAGFCVLSFYLGVFEASMGGFQASREILHSLAYLAVIIAIKFNITVLQSYLADTDLGAATARTYQKLQGYRCFRIIFFMFILKPSILLFYKLSFLPEGDEGNWLLVCLDNIIDWCLFVTLLYAFRPFDNFWLFKDLNIEGFGQDDDADDPPQGANENGRAQDNTHFSLGTHFSPLETIHEF